MVPSQLVRPESGLTATERLVLITLCIWVGTGSGAAWPSHKTLAAWTSLSVRTVGSALRQLVERGVLHRERRWKHNGEPNTNCYTVIGWSEMRQPRKREGGVCATGAGRYRQQTARGGAIDGESYRQQLPTNAVKENKEVNSSSALAALEGGSDDPPAGADVVPIGSTLAKARAMVEAGVRPERLRYPARMA